MTKNSPVLPLETYLHDLQAVLRDWPRERLEAWILGQARTHSPRERRAFLAELEGFDRAPATAVLLPGAHDLLARIDAFVEELQAGVYYRESDWGHEEGDGTWEDDEAWGDAWDEFLAEARQACLKGDWELGRQAYGELLQAFALQEEEDVFAEEVTPESVLESDLTEATLLYLRSVYETAPEDSLAESVLEAMEDLYLRPKDATLAALGATGADAEEGFRKFVADLASLLESRGALAPSGWDGYRDWLPEALVLSRGQEGLKAFLVRHEFRHAEACREDLRQTLGEQAWGDALNTARAAAKVLEDPRERTAMLDVAAYAAEQAGFQEEAADFRHTIWREKPGEFHLLAWLGSCPEGTWRKQLGEEIKRLPEPLERFPSSAEALRSLLRDPWTDLAEGLAQAQRPQRWDRETRRLFTVLAVSTLESPEPPPSTLLAQAWCDAGRAEPEPWGRREDLAPDPELVLGPQDLFAWKWESLPLSAVEKVRIRESLVDASRRWSAAILKDADRQAYFEAARLMGIAAETLIMAGQGAEGRRHLQDMVAAFPRHRAFAQEMAAVRAQSSLLKFP